MQDNRILSAISYLSIFFAPFIVPVIVYIVTKDSTVKYHSKKALLSHLVPVLSFIVMFIALITTGYSNNEQLFFGTFIIFIAITFVLNIAIIIYNVVKAVKLYI